MSTLLAILIIIWLIGAPIALIIGIMTWLEWEDRHSARLILTFWAWPLWLIPHIHKIIKTARQPDDV